jgi:glycerophosphoryl diester phosphodiesterase
MARFQRGLEEKMKETVWVSHRGVKKRFTENSEGAFLDAIAEGFLFLETDLRVSGDGHLVVSHDDNLIRVSGNDVTVSTSTWSELCQLRLKCGQGILHWNQLVKSFSDVHWIFDVKPESAKQVIDYLADWSLSREASTGILKRARFLFWSEAQESYFRQLFPESPTLARSTECWRAGVASLLGLPQLSGIQAGRIYSIPPRLPILGLNVFRKRVVDSYHRRGAMVLGYLPETAEQIDLALRVGCDWILTDHDRR